ncbi:TBC1 domain family protein [Perkinsela sp. CCAP 1560/4]|nr:TBC1 domain family protein [Perkinsela sp. CCAP 1560/4]|eukprot:KNH01743.1 TBC1 domain family protein [Perkinsela sp. CCAP 1560/4]
MSFRRFRNENTLSDDTRQIVDHLRPSVNDQSSSQAQFEKLTQESVWDVQSIRRLAWPGVDVLYRAKIWGFLLGVLPADRSTTKKVMERRRWEYQQMCLVLWDHDTGESLYPSSSRPDTLQAKIAQLLQTPTTPPKKADYQKLMRMCQHIEADVCRTSSCNAFIRTPWAQNVLRRILTCWTWAAPSIGYSQGMSEVIVPFLSVNTLDALSLSDRYPITIHTVAEFTDMSQEALQRELSDLPNETLSTIEADTFWYVHRFLHMLQPFCTSDHSAIHVEMERTEKVLRMVDFRLFSHLKLHDIHVQDFAYRWFRCLLVRELPMELVIRLWDTYLAEGSEFLQFHAFVCASILCSFSNTLLELASKEEVLLYLKAIPKAHMTPAWIQGIIKQSFISRHMYYRS